MNDKLSASVCVFIQRYTQVDLQLFQIRLHSSTVRKQMAFLLSGVTLNTIHHLYCKTPRSHTSIISMNLVFSVQGHHFDLLHFLSTF